MEGIKKTISLEPYYSRQKSTIPFVGMSDDEYYPNLDWGKIAFGVDFDELYTLSGATAVGLYGEGIRKLGRMNFGEIMKMYSAAKRGDIVDIDDENEPQKYRSIVQFVDSKKVIDSPTPAPDPCCDPCAVPSPPPEYEMDSGSFYFAPSVNFDFCLVQSANIIGAYTFATKDWFPGKRYFAGDKVIYDGKTYKLKEFDVDVTLTGSGVNCHGEPLMSIGFYKSSPASAFTEVVASFVAHDDVYGGLSESLFNEFVVNSEEEIVEMGYIYAKMPVGEDKYVYYVRPSWGGYNNAYDGTVYFDVLYNRKDPDMGFKMYGQYDTEHWRIAEDVWSNGEYEVSSSGNSIVVVGHQSRDIGFDDITMRDGIPVMPNVGPQWESKLVNFRRNTVTVAADGTKLPGRLTWLEGATGTFNVLDLPYLIGTIKNIDTTGEEVFGDYLADIKIEPDHHSLISIYHIEEVTDGPHQRTISGETYSYTNYSYVKTDVWERSPEPSFKGSIQKSGDSFTICNEWSEVIFTCPDDLADNDYKISITVGDEEIIAHEKDEGEITVAGITVSTTPGKLNLPAYSVVGVIDGGTSCNGDGFTIQPTGGTQENHDVRADKILEDYGESGEYVTFQTLDTYEKLVENWAGGNIDETGWITFKYYIGAVLELEKNDEGNVEKDAPYIYNGGERRLIYQDKYRFQAKRVEADVEKPGTDGELYHCDVVYLDIDYDSAKRDVVLENINDYRTSVIIADITATTQSMTDGGSPVSLNFQNADYFMEDYQLGLSFVANNNTNVYIDRGSATAFERHMRLSEVDTMEDLEIIGNGTFFRLKS